jgi:hypothetical protein
MWPLLCTDLGRRLLYVNLLRLHLKFVLTWRSNSLTVVPIAFERSRIRATYGIEGSQGRDWVCAICCPWCVLLKNDREVRAREGNQKFVSNKKYKEYVDVQPQAPLPMMYQPPESFFDRDQVLPDHVEKTPRKKTVVRERSGNRPAVDGARSLSNVPSITPHPRSVDLSPVPGDGTASLRSRRASAALDNSEPSYRHDFTDCDRSVLEYLERQGSAVGAASKQRVVGSFSRSVAPMMLGRRSSSYSL